MKKIYLFISLLIMCGLLLGNVQTINAAVTAVAGTEMQDGDINPPGCYGYSDPGDAIVFPIEAGHQIIIASEYWGNFSAEQQVSSVTFETAKPTAEYPAYVNNHFVIKIYEGGQLNGNLVKNGNSNLIDKYRGTLVYEQEYTQKAYGVQTIDLKQPYNIKDSTCFWIAIEAKDNTLFKKWRERNGDAMASTAYKNYVMGANFLYLYTRLSKTSDDDMIDFLFLNGVGIKSSNNQVIPYAENYLLTFCVSAATAPSVTPSNLAFNKEGGSQDIEVLSATMLKSGWSATTDADWLTLSTVEGPGSGAKTVVTVTADANSTGKVRNATIAITQGQKIQTVKVAQDNISAPGFYGDALAKTIAGVEANTSVILCPEQLGNYRGGQKVSAVKFYINDPSTTSSYKDYTNKDITIKIYEGSAVNADFAKSGKTKNIDECLGKLVKSYPYTVEKYGAQTVNFEDEDQYEIQDGVTFWIALEFPGKTLMVYDKEVLDTSDSYTAVEAYKLSNHKYLVTTFSNSVLYLQDAFAATKVETRYQIYNKNFYFQFQLANPTLETRNCDIAAKLYDYTTGALKTLPKPIALSDTDDLAKIAPRFINSGPDTVRTGNLDFTISLGDVNVYHQNTTYSSVNPGTGNYTFTTTKDVTYTAQQMNDLMLYGEFDMKLAIKYDGYDPDLSNNIFVATVNRERPSFDITLEIDSSFLDGAVLKGAGQYKLGEEYTITAELMPGVEFIGWYTKEGYEISKDITCTFIATENRTFCAKYKSIIYNIEVAVNSDTAGTACCSRVAKYGDEFDVEAKPNAGFVFVNWTENGQEVSTDAIYHVVVANNRSLMANFIDEKTIIFDVTVDVAPMDGGIVEGAGKYSMNSTASLKAVPNEGYRFVAWIQDDKVLTKEENYSFTVTDNVKLTANFEKIPVYTVSVTINPDTTCGFVTGAGSYQEGKEVTLEAVANNKSYRFANWTVEDSVVSTATTYTFVVNSDCNIVANFELIPNYEITATANPEEAGTITGAGSYMDGATAILTAVANDEYVFTCWMEGEDTVSTENVYTFMVTGPRALVANFTAVEAPKYTISVTLNPEEGGSVEGAGEYEANETVKLVATANEEYEFIGWTENGDTLSKALEFSFEVTADRALVANFLKKTAIYDFVKMDVNVYPNPSNGNFHVHFGELTGKVVYQLVDVRGALIATEEMMLDGQSVVDFNYDLPQGTYFVRIISNQQSAVKPVVIVR